jgi:seryl-tRNA(Sec) selenium transferase
VENFAGWLTAAFGRLSLKAILGHQPPHPVIGRIENGFMLFDLRCLAETEETEFVAQLSTLSRLGS